jgi:hypothetical protein
LFRAFKLLAPYIALLVFWCVFKNALGAILAYHVQILFWSRKELPVLLQGWHPRLFLWTVIPCATAGPLAYLLLPWVSSDLAGRLADYGLAGTSFLIMIPYFGLVHPLLEQIHWKELRCDGWLGHLVFAGYHAIVLGSLMTPPWILLCMLLLVFASILWTVVQSRTRGGLLVPALGHVVADLGIVIAAWIHIS